MQTDEEVKQNLAANILRILEARGWDQPMLAEATGEWLSTINRICRGENLPRVGVVSRIAEALDVSIDRLIAPPPSEPPSRRRKEVAATS